MRATMNTNTMSMGKYIVPLILSLIAVAVRLLGGAHTIDDAYITFRYAENIASGQGFVYNPGEHVLGTTTPLYALLLAGITKLLHAPLPSVGLVVASLADGVTAALVYVQVAHVTKERIAATLAAVTFALVPASIFYAQSGMETSLFTCLLIMCCWRYLLGDSVGWAIAGALAVLTRPEALLLIILLLLHDVWLNHRQRLSVLPWRPLLIIIAICAPWLLFSTIYFGKPLPQSIIAKSGDVYWVNPLDNVHLLEQHMGGLFFGASLSQEGCLLIGVATLLTWCAPKQAARAIRPILLFVWLFVAAYAVAGFQRHWMFDWYDIPLVPFYCIVFYAGADRVVRLLGRVPRHAGVSALGALVLSVQLYGLSVGHAMGKTVVTPHYGASVSREDDYARLCERYGRRFTTKTVLAAPEIGALGYYCHADILDTVGLITPGIGRYYPVSPTQLAGGANYAIPPALIAAKKPQYIASLEVFIRHSLLRDPRFLHNYREVGHISSTAFASHGLLIFERVSSSDRRRGL